jgi:hypothetical protein
VESVLGFGPAYKKGMKGVPVKEILVVTEDAGFKLFEEGLCVNLIFFLKPFNLLYVKCCCLRRERKFSFKGVFNFSRDGHEQLPPFVKDSTGKAGESMNSKEIAGLRPDSQPSPTINI